MARPEHPRSRIEPPHERQRWREAQRRLLDTSPKDFEGEDLLDLLDEADEVDSRWWTGETPDEDLGAGLSDRIRRGDARTDVDAADEVRERGWVRDQDDG